MTRPAIQMNRFRKLQFPALVLLVAAGCGGGEAGSSASSETAEEAEEGPPPVRVEVRGTAEEPVREGFVLIDSDCTESSRETPRLGPLDIQVPADWELPGTVAGGPRRGEVRFYAGSVRKTLSVRMEDQREGTAPKFTPGEDDEQVGTVEWSGEQVPVYLGSNRYWAFLPAITVHGLADVYAFVRLGGRGSGDVTKLDRDEVLTIFESARLDPCAVESYAGGYQNAEVIYLDRQ